MVFLIAIISPTKAVKNHFQCVLSAVVKHWNTITVIIIMVFLSGQVLSGWWQPQNCHCQVSTANYKGKEQGNATGTTQYRVSGSVRRKTARMTHGILTQQEDIHCAHSQRANRYPGSIPWDNKKRAWSPSLPQPSPVASTLMRWNKLKSASS